MAGLFIGFLVEKCAACQSYWKSDFGLHRVHPAWCVRPSKKKVFLVPARFIFWSRLCLFYLLVVTFVRTKTKRRYFYFVASSPRLTTKKTLNVLKKRWLLSAFQLELRLKFQSLAIGTLGPSWIGQLPCRIYFVSSLLENLTMEEKTSIFEQHRPRNANSFLYQWIANRGSILCCIRWSTVFFVWKWGRFSNSRGLLPVLHCMHWKWI